MLGLCFIIELYLHPTVQPFRGSNLIVFRLFSKLCSHHHYLTLEHNIAPEEPTGHCPFPTPPIPWQPLISLFLFCLFWTFYVIGSLLCLASFQHISIAHLCCSISVNIFKSLFSDLNIPFCRYSTLSSVDGHLDVFHRILFKNLVMLLCSLFLCFPLRLWRPPQQTPINKVKLSSSLGKER